MEIRKCRTDEIEELMIFFDEHWQKNHILSKSKELMYWQYYNPIEKNYNFLIAKKNNEILGLIGFIPNYKFDKSLINNSIIWISTWKVREDIEDKTLGLKLLAELENLSKNTPIAVVGNNELTIPIYKLFKYKTGELNHYYMKNDSIGEFKLAKIDYRFNYQHIKKNNKKEIKLMRLEDINKINLDMFKKSFKSKKYIINRYLKNPFYTYKVFGIFEFNLLKSLMVVRKIDVEDRSVLRIVDFFGELNSLDGIYNSLQNLLIKECAEYIDFYTSISLDRFINNSGFFINRYQDEIIIPNYFEPFEKKNIRIRYAYKNVVDNFIIYKGDGDQDRPSIL